MVVLVLLLVLSVLGYTLSSKVSAQLHRQRYMVDYQAAQYARDSAVKYAFATLADINSPEPVARPNEPDFSDLFLMTEAELQAVLSDWAERISAEKTQGYMKPQTDLSAESLGDFNDINDINDVAMFGAPEVDFNDANLLEIPGPYGPKWPLVKPAMEFDIGTASVKIELHDENAKYPLGWAMLDDPEMRREALAGFETFCEWMDVNRIAVGQLEEQLAQLNEEKRYRLKFEEIKQVTKKKIKIPRSSRLRRTRRDRRVRRTRTKTIVKKVPATVHLTDFAKLFSSSLVDTETLARPTIASDDRKESALKYIGLWGSNKVNVNSAPRQVLEATFMFGGDAQPIAQGIIERRRIKPFEDVNDLKRALFRYSGSVERCKDFIVTDSDFFTIRVTATSGVAEASAVVSVRKTKDKYQKIAVLAD